jgi:hypothetical protein
MPVVYFAICKHFMVQVDTEELFRLAVYFAICKHFLVILTSETEMLLFGSPVQSSLYTLTYTTCTAFVYDSHFHLILPSFPAKVHFTKLVGPCFEPVWVLAEMAAAQE